MAIHSSTLAWKIPWMEELGRLQSMGSLKVGHDSVTSLSLFTFMHWRRKWQSTPVFLPGESQGRRSLVGCRLWSRTETDTTEATWQQQQQQQQQQCFLCTDFSFATLLNSLINSSNFLIVSLGFAMYIILSSANSESFTSSFTICKVCFNLSFFIYNFVDLILLSFFLDESG